MGDHGMTILPAPSLASAQGFNSRALAFLRAEDDAHGSGWSDIYAEPAPGARFAILFSGDISGAFTEAEIATVIDGATWPVYQAPEQPAILP